MYQLAIKTFVLCTIPKLVDKAIDIFDDSYDHFFGENTTITTTKKQRKSPDNSPWNQWHYDETLSAEVNRRRYNACTTGVKRTQIDLTEELNEKFGMTKSRASYWRLLNQIRRDDLPPKKEE